MIFFLLILLNQTAQVREQDTESVGSLALEDGDINESLWHGDLSYTDESFEVVGASSTTNPPLERNENLQHLVRELELRLQQLAQKEEDVEALAQRQEEATASSTQKEIADTSREEGSVKGPPIKKFPRFCLKCSTDYVGPRCPNCKPKTKDASSSTQKEIADTSRDEEIALELQDELNAQESPPQPQQVAASSHSADPSATIPHPGLDQYSSVRDGLEKYLQLYAENRGKAKTRGYEDRARISGQSEKVPLEAKDYHRLMRRLGRPIPTRSSALEKRIEEVRWWALQEFNIDPINVGIYNMLLSSYIREDRFHDARRLIEQTMNGPFSPRWAWADAISYNTLIKGHVDKHQTEHYDAALGIKNFMRDRLLADTATYDILIDGLNKLPQIDAVNVAQTLKNEMNAYRVNLTEVTYHSLILLYAIKPNNRDKILQLLQEMVNEGFDFTNEHWFSPTIKNAFKDLYQKLS